MAGDGCKPDSVGLVGANSDGHFSHATLPGGAHLGRAGDPCPLFCLAPRGVCPALLVTQEAVGFYPAFSPLPLAETWGGIFSVTLSVVTSLRSPLPRFHEARCLAVSGLSSPQRHFWLDPKMSRATVRHRHSQFTTTAGWKKQKIFSAAASLQNFLRNAAGRPRLG